MKRDSILASVTGLVESSTWAGKQGGAVPASLPPADTPPMPNACSKTMSFPNPSLNTFTERLVLVAEDEPGIVGVLEAYLRRDGFRTCTAMDGVEAMRLFRELRPDAVLLDVNLPGMDGLDVLRAIRDEGQTPVIIATALADDVDKLLGLRLGADDYVTKPFNPAEVVARLRAVLRRAGAQANAAPIRVGGIEIDEQDHVAVAHVGGGRSVPLQLTLTEFRLLACLASQPRRCFSRGFLIEHCLPESDALERVIDSHISKLRRKLHAVGQADMIEAVRGVGYRLWREN